MSNMYPSETPTIMQRVFDKYCEPRLVYGLPQGTELLLMTAKVDRWDMRRDTIAGDHDGNMSMWAMPFQGGVAIARYILDNAEVFVGKTVLDIGAGSGLVAIAAAKVGATAIAIDSSWMACRAIEVNAALNSVKVSVGEGSAVNAESFVILDDDGVTFGDLAARADIITAGDVFYHDFYAKRIAETLKGFAREGKAVLASSGEEDMNRFFSDAASDILGVRYDKKPFFIRLLGRSSPPSMDRLTV